MKKLLLSTALTFVAMSGAASAQSVLERVLGQIDNSTNLASVNGTFANIAENIGGTQTVYYNTTNNETLTADEVAAIDAAAVQDDYDPVLATDYVTLDGSASISAAAYALLSATDKAGYAVAGASAYYYDGNGALINAAEYATLYATEVLQDAAIALYEPVVVSGLLGVDGSINTTITGLTSDTQQAIAGLAIATEWGTPTIDIGNLSTTALGAVNTGEITLGVNGSVDDAKTTSTQAVSTVMSQIGGSADTGALVLNVASNMTGVNGSINTTMAAVNGSVGNASTTALGAVNTGTITSGVNAAVQGIVGTSGQ